MSILQIGARRIALDQDDCLVDLNDWDEDVAQALAAREGIELSAEHWEVLHLLRAFYAEFQLSPATRPLVKYVAQHLGPDKGNEQHLNRLFNGRAAKLGARLAGLPKPSNCL